jgi:hypothetical protein
MATASAQVTSNAVGYVNKQLSQGFSLIANPLSNGDNAIGTVIPSAPIGSTVFTFAGGAFSASTFLGVWAPDASLPVGEGFFIDVPEATTVTFVGDVLQGEATNKQVAQGLSIQGSLVPQAGTFTELGFPASVGDTVFSWNGSGYDSTAFLGVWAPTEPSLGVGDAVFVDKAEAAAWNRNFVIQ